jgi:hypothetical protein
MGCAIILAGSASHLFLYRSDRSPVRPVWLTVLIKIAHADS